MVIGGKARVGRGWKQRGSGGSRPLDVGSRGQEKRGQVHVIRSDGKANLKAG